MPRRNKTWRETYGYLIGYDFGEDGIYDGGYWDEDTNQKQYAFILPDKSIYITDYKGFREVIDKYDIPKRK